jgi:hypothetical protein
MLEEYLDVSNFNQKISVPKTKKKLKSILEFLIKNLTDLYFNAYIYDDHI